MDGFSPFSKQELQTQAERLEMRHGKQSLQIGIPKENSLNAYILIQEKDSLDPVISQSRLNRMGYEYLRANKFSEARELFKINIALYPNKSNVYDSMGDAFKKEKDTLKAIEYYKKSLAINPENRNSLRNLKKLKKNTKK